MHDVVSDILEQLARRPILEQISDIAYADIITEQLVEVRAKRRDTDKVKEIDKAAKDEAKAAVKYADESPFPPPQELLTDVYHSVDNPGTHTNEGEIFFNDQLPF